MPKIWLFMCVLAVLGSQGIVVKCTAAIFSRTVDCEKLALMVFNLPPLRRREEQVFIAKCLQARHFRPHHNEKSRSSAANKRQKSRMK